jgi:excisionase family DNA binding protein
MSGDLLSLARMARRLGVTCAWLREQADAGKIPYLAAGRRYLFNPVALQEALAVKAARTRQGGSRE